jgi:hypothetical protein
MVTMVTTFFRVCRFAIRETTIVFLYMATIPHEQPRVNRFYLSLRLSQFSPFFARTVVTLKKGRGETCC